MKASTALGIAAGTVVAGVAAWALWFGAHFNDSGAAPPQPLQGFTGEVWWIVIDPNVGVDYPTTLGDVLSAKQGTPTEGGLGTTVYVVRLSHDFLFRPGYNVQSARRETSWP